MPNATWILLLLLTACGFPRPADVTGDDATAGCARDQDCSAPSAFCVDSVCVGCRDNTSCPTSSPVCDQTSHGCRACNQDSECDSGACDLAAGTCVDQRAILYASPSGNATDPCTRATPCSFVKASSAVDIDHSYVVLLPGAHLSSALFDGTKATVCATNATMDPAKANIVLTHGASVAIRGLKMVQTTNITVFGAGSAIVCNGADLTLDNVELQLTFLHAIEGGPTITIRNSTISNGFLEVSAHLAIDRTTFLPGAGIESFGTDQPMEVTNSVFVSTPGQQSISINGTTDTTSLGTAAIVNNTFINGTIQCSGSDLYGKILQSNIFL